MNTLGSWEWCMAKLILIPCIMGWASISRTPLTTRIHICPIHPVRCPSIKRLSCTLGGCSQLIRKHLTTLRNATTFVTSFCLVFCWRWIRARRIRQSQIWCTCVYLCYSPFHRRGSWQCNLTIHWTVLVSSCSTCPSLTRESVLTAIWYSVRYTN